MTPLDVDQQRPIPALAWGRAAVLGLVLLAAGLACWELYWRGQQFRPSYRNSDGLWALTRRKVEAAGGRGTAVIGSSRALFDLNLETWAGETGRVPIQLALEGTNPRPVLAHLAESSPFRGLLVVGVTPGLFFTPGFGYRSDALARYLEESPSQWAGQRLSMMIEPFVAFYSFDTALFTVLRRQEWWPQREGMPPPRRDVRKLSNMRITRQSDLWERLDNDPAYARLAQEIWLEFLFAPREAPPPEEARRQLEAVFEEVRGHVETIRARGGEVVFIRCPSTSTFREVEAKAFPRERFWDVLLDRADAAGVHFEDYDDLKDVTVPEWSHISSRDTPRFTRSLMQHLREALDRKGIERQELEP